MTKIAFRFFMDYEKEEKWLNEMESKGFHFLRYCFFFYIFERGNPNTYTYGIELLEDMSHHKNNDYLNFLNDTYIEHVASWARWVYLRKRKEKGPLNLFTDLSSKYSHFKRIFTFQVCLLPIMMASFIKLLDLTWHEGDFFYVAVSVLYTIFLIFFTSNTIRTHYKIKHIKENMQIHE